MAREVLISNPNEVTAYLSLFPVPSAVVSPVRKIEYVNKRGRYFYIEFEVVSLEGFREAESPIQTLPIEPAIRLDGQVVLDTLSKYDKSILKLLAGISGTVSVANLSWAIVRKMYGQEEETFGKT